MKVIAGIKLYDLEEVGSMLGVSKNSVQKYCRGKGIEYTIINRRKYLSESQIRKLVTPRAI